MNKIQRVKAVLDGKMPDITPAGFWFHYSGQDSVEKMIDNHLTLYNETDMDIVKVMQDYPYPIIGDVKKPSDWKKIRFLGTSSKEYKKLESVLKGIVDQVGDQVMIFQTMFGCFKAAAMQFGDDLVMNHAKQDPDSLEEGIRIICESMKEWTYGFLNAGATGIYYSAQFAEVGRFSNDQWSKLVKPFDLEILNAVSSQQDKYTILHVCGEPDYDFKTNIQWFEDYNAHLINWSVKDNKFSLEQGLELFHKPILGGMNNKGNILNGTDEQIKSEVEDIINLFGQAGFMLGADCTIQGENISIEKIRTAVQCAHNFRK